MYEFLHHEDDVGLVQILPIEWWDHCIAERAALAEHSERHRNPDGIGWDQMYTQREPPRSLPRLDLSERRFVELLRSHGDQFDRVISTLAEVDAALGIRAIGFGPARNSSEPWGNPGIIADLDGEKVASIWCRLDAADRQDRNTLAAMLMALSRERPMLLVDWRNGALVDLRSRQQIDAYLT